jgi:hypothetical protein
MGQIIAILVLVAVFVLWLTHALVTQEQFLALIAALALAVILAGGIPSIWPRNPR